MSFRRAFLFALTAAALAWTSTATAGEAAFITSDSKVFFFKDGEYVRHLNSKNAADEGYPKRITNETWPGLAPYAAQIDAAFTMANHTFFFLSDGTYLKYDLANDRLLDGYPRPINDQTWPGLGAYARQIDAAVAYDSNHIYFFLTNGQYVLYQLDLDRVLDGYPKSLDSSEWKPLRASPESHIRAVVPWGMSKIFLYTADQEYYRFDRSNRTIDSGYPRRMNEANWEGVGEWFNRTNRPKNRWNGQPLTTGTQVSFKLPRRMMGPVNTGPSSQVVGRFLTVDPQLAATSTTAGKENVFTLHTVERRSQEGLIHNHPGVYQKVVIEAPNGKYLGVAEARGGLIVADRGRDEATVFVLDQTWGDQVALFVYRGNYRWTNRDDIPLMQGVLGTYFYSYGDKTYGSINLAGALTAGSLLEMYLVE